MSNNKYGNDSIEALELPLRSRPESQLGSKGVDGAKHLIVEMVGNAIDEHEAGYGDKIDIAYNADGSFMVRDYGRGIPLGWNENAELNGVKGHWNWWLIYCQMFAGGKFKDEENQAKLQKLYKQGVDWNTLDMSQFQYLFSVGLNGIGSMATQQTSEWFRVISVTDGKRSEMYFEEGRPAFEELQVTDTDEPNGTTIMWKPDDRVFTSTNVPEKFVHNLAESLSYTAGVDVTYTNKGGETFEYKRQTIQDWFGEDSVHKTEYYCEYNSYNRGKGVDGTVNYESLVELANIDMVIGVSNRHKGFTYIHNRVKLHGGSHHEGLVTALMQFFSEKTGINKPNFEDIQAGVSCVISSQSNITSYRNQTKDSLDDAYIRNGILKVATDLLNEAWRGKAEWLINAVEYVKTVQEERERIAELRRLSTQVRRTVKARKTPPKFVSCDAYEKGRYDDVELLLVEGDSAMSAVRDARDSKYQAIYPLRGKSLNLYKANIEDILKNAEVQAIMNILGCGVDLGIDGLDFEDFDISKVKVGKVIICTDADSDGSHIAMLIFLMMRRLFPELVERGMLYIARTPLRELELTGGRKVYVFNDEEYREIGAKETIVKQKRFKGLGKVNAPVLAKTTLNPHTRTLVQLQADRDDLEVENYLNMLFGKDTTQRREAIFRGIMGDEATDAMLDMLEGLDVMFDGMEIKDDREIHEIEY